MSIPAPSTQKFGLANKTLANVTTAANACNSWLHQLLKTLLGSTTGFTAGTGGAPPSSAYWTIESSSNGTTASTADNFSAAYVAGEWLSNTAGNAHSWFVIKSPASPGILDGPWYILVSKDSATATTYRVSLSKTAWNTNGTATADPTNGGTVSTTGSTSQFNPSSTTAGKSHFYCDAKGNFAFMCSRDGAGLVETLFMFSELEQNQPSGDTLRAIGYIAHSTSGIFNQVNSGSNLSGASILGFQRNGAAHASSQLIITSHNIPLTELNGINSDVEGFKWGFVISTLTGNQAVRGCVLDMYQCTTGITNGANYPDTINPIWSAIGSTSTGGKMLIPMPNVLAL